MKARTEGWLKAGPRQAAQEAQQLASKPELSAVWRSAEPSRPLISLPPPAHFGLAAMDELTGLPLAFGKKAPPKKADTSRIDTTKRADAPVQPVSSPHLSPTDGTLTRRLGRRSQSRLPRSTLRRKMRRLYGRIQQWR